MDVPGFGKVDVRDWLAVELEEAGGEEWDFSVEDAAEWIVENIDLIAANVRAEAGANRGTRAPNGRHTWPTTPYNAPMWPRKIKRLVSKRLTYIRQTFPW